MYRSQPPEDKPKINHWWAFGPKSYVIEETRKQLHYLLEEGIPWESIKISQSLVTGEVSDLEKDGFWNTTIWWIEFDTKKK